MKRGLLISCVRTVLLIATIAPLCLYAQFHNPGKGGVNQQAVNSAQNQATTMGATPPDIGGGIGGGDMILSEGYRNAFKQAGVDVSLGRMDAKQVDIWSRAIHHEDGSYTESSRDESKKTLQQDTKSKNGTILQSRLISLDQYSRPSEVMIYDGRGQFKYRGTLLYDTLGRFREEQIYDVKGTLLRRKIQEYTANGQKIPVHCVDLVDNVPEDLKLVITRDDDRANAAQAATASKKPKLFDRTQKATQGADSPPIAAETTSSASPPAAQKKGLKLGRLFGGGKKSN